MQWSGAVLGLSLLASTNALAADRAASLREQNGISGSSGLLRLTAPSSGASGTFRLSLLADAYSGSGFLCTAKAPCGTSTKDRADHFGTSAGISVTPLAFLEAYASLRSFVNGSDRRSPGLLAVLNNTALGAKVFTPAPLAGLLQLGGDAELDLLSGSGSVGFDGGAVGGRLLALAALDFRGLSRPLPLRLLTNVGYAFDNSHKLITDVEASRGVPISRVERFGLGINRVDHLELGFGVEGAFSIVRPFVEWNVAPPVNRQDYTCHVKQLESGDSCLAKDQKLSAFPSLLTLGARVTPWLPGLTGTLALDIGTSGTSNFIEETAPTLPWDLWFGVGYAFDTVKPPPERVVVREPAPLPPPAPSKPELRVRGLVHEKDKTDVVADAIVRYRGRELTAMASGADGRFVSEPLAVGSYSFDITASGFKPGECSVTLNDPTLARTAAAAPAATGSPPSAPPKPASPSAETFFEVDCALEALPRAGSVNGRVSDADSGTALSGVSVELTDVLHRSLTVTTDASGRFRFEHVLPGGVALKADAPDFLFHSQTLEIAPREDAQVELALHKRPKVSLVQVAANELKIRQQIHFDNDSATILGDSNALLEQIADVLARNAGITQVEIQGHTDNVGPAEHNRTLSEARANAVADWLAAHGIDRSRLVARGYGQDKPISPNVTPAGRARNRRVQFMIQH